MADYLDNWRGFLSSVEIGMVFCGGRRRSKRLIRGTIGLNICGIVSGRFLTIVHKSRRPFLRRLISLTYDPFSGVTGRPIKSVTLRRMERKEVTVPGQGMIKGWITGRMARTCRYHSVRPDIGSGAMQGSASAVSGAGGGCFFSVKNRTAPERTSEKEMISACVG